LNKKKKVKRVRLRLHVEK